MDAPWTDLEGCTLPAADRPARLGAFDRLVVDGLLEVRRVSGTRASLVFDAEVGGRVRDLVAAESGCCSFLGFAVTDDGRQVTVDVEVDEAHAAALAALVDRAGAAPGVPS